MSLALFNYRAENLMRPKDRYSRQPSKYLYEDNPAGVLQIDLVTDLVCYRLYNLHRTKRVVPFFNGYPESVIAHFFYEISCCLYYCVKACGDNNLYWQYTQNITNLPRF